MRDLNFFKPYLGKSKQKINFQRYVYGVMVLVGLLIIVSFSVNKARIMLLDKSISSYNEKLSDPEIQNQLQEADNVNKQIDILKRYDKALNDVAMSVKNRENVSESLLKDISSTLPNEVLFKSLDVVENNVAIKGTSTSREAIAELERKLRELPIVADIYINSINTQGAVEGEYSFDIKCVLKDVG